MKPIRLADKLVSDFRERKKDPLVRFITAPFRQLPAIIIIGAQKSGTTSLFNYLVQHPEIVGSHPKEVHYFDNQYDYGSLWYRSHFPYRSNKLALEASPYYLCYPHAPKRIHRLVPEVKLIAILRNPTERAISHYFHQVRQGRESLPIEEAIIEDEARVGHFWDKLVKDESYQNSDFQGFSYKPRGRYLEQLERFWEYFPAEQLLVLNSDDLFTEPLQTLREIFEFVGVDPDFTDLDLKKYTVGVNRKKAPDELYAYLDDYFKPFNQELYERLGQDFNW